MGENHVSEFPCWKPTEDFPSVSLGFPCWETQEYWQCTLKEKSVAEIAPQWSHFHVHRMAPF